MSNTQYVVWIEKDGVVMRAKNFDTREEAETHMSKFNWYTIVNGLDGYVSYIEKVGAKQC